MSHDQQTFGSSNTPSKPAVLQTRRVHFQIRPPQFHAECRWCGRRSHPREHRLERGNTSRECRRLDSHWDHRMRRPRHRGRAQCPQCRSGRQARGNGRRIRGSPACQPAITPAPKRDRRSGHGPARHAIHWTRCVQTIARHRHRCRAADNATCVSAAAHSSSG